MPGKDKDCMMSECGQVNWMINRTELKSNNIVKAG